MRLFFWGATSNSSSISLAYACVPYRKWIPHTHTHTEKYPNLTNLSNFDRYFFKLIMQSMPVSQPVIFKKKWPLKTSYLFQVSFLHTIPTSCASPSLGCWNLAFCLSSWPLEESCLAAEKSPEGRKSRVQLIYEHLEPGSHPSNHL